jgi:DNA replication protein DnaC
MKAITSPETTPQDALSLLLKTLHLPTFLHNYEEISLHAEKGGWGFSQYLRHLCELELDDRRQRKVERLQKQSGLPSEKTMATLDLARLPAAIRRQLPTLCEGHFLSQADNILAFGLPGRGKTHLLCAIAHELIQRGYAVLFTPAFRLVQQLLAAKRDLLLEKELKKLDRFDAVLIDDIGYVQQDREEMEVLFTFLAERYERRSVMITSNLVFSEWDQIFKNPMTTAAAIDRLVHHSIILELPSNKKSIRQEDAEKRSQAQIVDKEANPK